jgi:hypothetical protein
VPPLQTVFAMDFRHREKLVCQVVYRVCICCFVVFRGCLVRSAFGSHSFCVRVMLVLSSGTGNPKEGLASSSASPASGAGGGHMIISSGSGPVAPLIATMRDDVMYPPIFPAHLSRAAMALLCGLLHFNPDTRISVRDALNHPFVTSVPKGTHEELFRDDVSSPLGDLMSMQDDGGEGSPGSDSVFFPADSSAMHAKDEVSSAEVLRSTVFTACAMECSPCAVTTPVVGSSSTSAPPLAVTAPVVPVSVSPPPAPSTSSTAALSRSQPHATSTVSATAAGVQQHGAGTKFPARAQDELPQLSVDPNNTPMSIAYRTPVQSAADPNAACRVGSSPDAVLSTGSCSVSSTTPAPATASVHHAALPGEVPVCYGSLRDHVRMLPNSSAASTPRQSPMALHLMSSAVPHPNQPQVLHHHQPQHVLHSSALPFSSPLSSAATTITPASQCIVRGPSFSLSSARVPLRCPRASLSIFRPSLSILALDAFAWLCFCRPPLALYLGYSAAARSCSRVP